MLMKKTLRSRRGAAIEMAVVVMFLMMGLSIILVSVSTIQISQRNKDVDALNEKVELMEITDNIIKSGSPGEGYDLEITDEGKYIVRDSENNKIVLEFTVKDGKISSWN